MIVKQLLDAKREGHELPADDIRALIAAYAKGEVPDYQMSAFAMAVCCRGMSAAEIFALTDAMRLSGACLDWSDLDRPSADKHSTGGVGDKLSMVIQPLAAACGLAVPSLTGRGLGHTGGTADKLESIPGYNASLALSDFHRVVAQCGVSMTVQTPEICPADKKLYALRDVTGTVPSIPLIVASILSKKLAEGAGTLVFDVKCGRGAIMQTLDDARILADALVSGAKAAGRRAAALVTAMDEPLGWKVGNALEIQESIDALKGVEVPVVTELSVEFAALMVALAKDCPIDLARAECRARLVDGSAYRCFAEMVRLQGGDLEAFDRLKDDPELVVQTVTAAHGGFVAEINARAVAEAALGLGAGRTQLTDEIDPLAGVELLVRRGMAIQPGQPVARLYAKKKATCLPVAAETVVSAISQTEAAPAEKPDILERIG